MRSITLVAGLMPFLFYATRDQIFHFRGRRVSANEHLLHVAIGISIVTIVTEAFRGHYPSLLVALTLFMVVGGVDEYVFHHKIPGEESDLHAKGHLALLGWVVLVLAMDWLQAHGVLESVLSELSLERLGSLSARRGG